MANTKIYSNKGQKVKELSGPIIRGNKYPKGTIVTNDPNDPRLKMYQDSLINYNTYLKDKMYWSNYKLSDVENDGTLTDNDGNGMFKAKDGIYIKSAQEGNPKPHPLYPNYPKESNKNKELLKQLTPVIEPMIGRVHPGVITSKIQGINLSKTKMLNAKIPGGKFVMPLIGLDAALNIISMINDEKEIRNSKDPDATRSKLENEYKEIRNKILNPDLYNNLPSNKL